LGGRCAGRNADTDALAGNRVGRVHKLRVPQIHAASLMTSNERDVEQPERVAEVAMVRRGRAAGSIGREPMGSVVVRNDDGVAVGIVAATMAPIDRATVDDKRESRRHDAGQETMARFT